MIDAALYSKHSSNSYLVTRAVKTLYNAASAATLTLTGAAPAVTYRLSITLSGADCAGIVTINGSETLTFVAAAKKVTTTNLTANVLPAVTTANLNCNILIECIDVGGQPICAETLTSIDVSWNDTSKWIPAPEGGWTTITETSATTDNSSIAVGAILRKTSTGTDYKVRAVKPINNFLGLEVKRKLIF